MSTYQQRKIELHEALRQTLIKGFLNEKVTKFNKNITKWKAQLRRYCDSPKHEGGTILSDFLCLERKGRIAPGKYDELIIMFQIIDIRAVDIINKTTATIANIEKERKEKKAEKRKYASLRSVIKKSEITPDQLSTLYDMIQQILQHSKVSPHWETDLQEVPKNDGIAKTPRKIGTLQKWKSAADPVKLRQSVLEKGSSISKTQTMDWKALSHIIKFVNTFRKLNEYSLEKVYPDGMYVTGYEDELRKDDQQQTVIQNIGDFMVTFFSLAGYDMQDASVTTQMNFMEQDAFSKALKRRLPSQSKPRQVPEADYSSEEKATEKPKHFDVMISYQWGSKDVVLRVKSFLEKSRVSCWIDLDNIKGSTLQAMAEAVECSDLFLMCYSFKYFTSKNCRQEAEYANKLNKTIIPLKMERDYEPRGWLGMILGAKLFFEFSGKYPFDQKAQELLKEINSHLQNIPEVTSSENVMTTENDSSRKPMTARSQKQLESRENRKNADGDRLTSIRRMKAKVKPGIGQITCREGLTWLGNSNNVLISIDKDGKQKDMVCLRDEEIKYHAFTEEGDILLIHKNSLMRYVKRQLRPFISYFSDGYVATFVACSAQNGDILIGLLNKDEQSAKVVRFNKIGKELHVSEKESNGKPLFESPLHVAIKENEDVCISDYKKGVVVIDKTGNHRFTNPVVDAMGLCIDSQDNILVCDGSDKIHIITSEGKLQRTVSVNRPGVSAIAIDTNSTFLIGFKKSCVVEVYRYEFV